MRYLPILKGLVTFIPGAMTLRGSGQTKGSDSADYCYGVWLKHLTLLWNAGMRSIPTSIAELGPGDSLGTGLAALLCGAQEYVAFDVVAYANLQRNLAVFDRLVELFRARAPRPTKGWPDFDSQLDDKLFPSHILTDAVLVESLREERVAAIRRELQMDVGALRKGSHVSYRVPWSDPTVIQAESVDLIFSHSVMEHVNDVDTTYAACAQWLRRGGWMSSQIDFRSHSITPEWNGHLQYPEWLWNLVVGKRPYLLNRLPWSRHIDLIRANGLDICTNLRNVTDKGLCSDQLATEFRNRSQDDLTTHEAFIIAQKR